jgi:hypothetical protein
MWIRFGARLAFDVASVVSSDYYLDEFTFRFNRRGWRSRGKLFHRLLQQCVAIEPTPYKHLIKHIRNGPEHRQS